MNGPLMSLPPDLSPWTMFANAHIVVQAVMAGLALASLATWTVAAAKALELRQARRAAAAAFAGIADARSLAEAKAPDGPAAAMIAAAHTEVRLSLGLGANGVKDRIAARLSRIEAAAGRRVAAGTGVLATIGSTAPFVGLFGTVWGIMNSFVGIAQANTTNLAVVAPGIAEALLATALGLVAAIPAVVVYNICVRRIAAYRALLGDVAVALLGVVGRDLDRRVRPLSEAAE